MRELAEGLAASFGCKAELVYRRGTDALVNHAEQTEAALAAATALVGAAQVNGKADPVLGAEDFAGMLAARPGAFVFMGNSGGGATSKGLHTPDYDFNDDAIPYGVGYWVSLVHQELGGLER
jgi:hippurate hydrolase